VGDSLRSASASASAFVLSCECCRALLSCLGTVTLSCSRTSVLSCFLVSQSVEESSSAECERPARAKSSRHADAHSQDRFRKKKAEKRARSQAWLRD
jgi:hypothetical protein